jgi:hypothetical protein
MLQSDYRIHLSFEKNDYVVIRQNFPHMMIYVTLIGNEYEITRLTLMDNCSASVLEKVLIQFESYLRGETEHRMIPNESRINGWHQSSMKI